MTKGANLMRINKMQFYNRCHCPYHNFKTGKVSVFELILKISSRMERPDDEASIVDIRISYIPQHIYCPRKENVPVAMAGRLSGALSYIIIF